MQTTNKKRFSFAMLFALIAMLGFCMVACNDEEKSDEVVLEAFGPSPVALGGEITFLGQNLNQVSSIEFPMGYVVDRFESQDQNRIVVVATKDTTQAYEGFVTLHTSKGDIVTKTKLGYRQSALITGFSPATIKPGETLTISGVYLSSVQKIIFGGDVEVAAKDFKDVKNGSIVVTVPMTAVTGDVIVNDGRENIHSDGELTVLTPKVASFEAKAYKPGVDIITLKGSDLDLVKTVTFKGASVEEFDAQSAAELTFVVRATTKEGAFTVTSISGVESEAGEISLLAPTLASVTYSEGQDSYLTGSKVTVAGKDLDLATEVKVGTVAVEAKVAEDGNSLSFTIGETVASGAVSITTANGTTVSTDNELKVMACIITSTEEGKPNQLNANAGQKNTITGEALATIKSITVNGVEATDIKASEGGTSLTYMLADQACSAPSPTDYGMWVNDGLVITFKNGTSKAYGTWIVAPAYPYITSKLPESVLPGSALFVKGFRFNDMIDTESNNLKPNAVKIGGLVATCSIISDTEMFIVVPAGASGMGSIELTSAAGTSKSPEIQFSEGQIVKCTSFEVKYTQQWAQAVLATDKISEYSALEVKLANTSNDVVIKIKCEGETDENCHEIGLTDNVVTVLFDKLHEGGLKDNTPIVFMCKAEAETTMNFEYVALVKADGSKEFIKELKMGWDGSGTITTGESKVVIGGQEDNGTPLTIEYEKQWAQADIKVANVSEYKGLEIKLAEPTDKVIVKIKCSGEEDSNCHEIALDQEVVTINFADLHEGGLADDTPLAIMNKFDGTATLKIASIALIKADGKKQMLKDEVVVNWGCEVSAE